MYVKLIQISLSIIHERKYLIERLNIQKEMSLVLRINDKETE